MLFARRLTLITLLMAGIASPVFAQGPWSVFVGGGAAGFGGASTAAAGTVEGDITQYKPTPTTRFHLGAARAFGRGGVVVDVSYAKAGLGGYGGPTVVSLDPAITLYDVRLLGSYQLVRFGEGSSVRLALGPMLQVWSGDAVIGTQTRLGAAAAITVSAPLSRRFGLLVSGSLGVAGSPLSQETLDEVGLFEPVSTWTRELAVGLRFAL